MVMLQAVFHTMEHEGPDPDSDVSIEPEATTNDLETFIGEIICQFAIV